MKSFKKTVSLLLAVMMLAGMFVTLKPETEAKAEGSVATPTFTLKRVNKGTGVKITINKTKGAAGYYIYMTKRDNAYSSYLFEGGDYEQKIAQINKNGKAKRTYTIKGLPKGTYSFKVQAYADTEYSDFSAEKSIYVKAAKKKTTAEKTYDFSKAKVGDTIMFGSYEQDDDMTNGKEEIEWIVLAKDSKRILVVSKYVLDCLPYNNNFTDITWENSSIREWLNSKFYTTAFTKKERKMISKVKLTNDDDTDYGTEGGKDTKDKVFLLSLNDVVNTAYGFDSASYERDVARRCAPTAYAAVQGAYPYAGDEPDYYTAEGKAACCWWLRSPGDNASCAVEVNYQGCVWDYDYVNYDGVRPAIYINLES